MVRKAQVREKTGIQNGQRQIIGGKVAVFLNINQRGITVHDYLTPEERAMLRDASNYNTRFSRMAREALLKLQTERARCSREHPKQTA